MVIKEVEWLIQQNLLGSKHIYSAVTVEEIFQLESKLNNTINVLDFFNETQLEIELISSDELETEERQP